MSSERGRNCLALIAATLLSFVSMRLEAFTISNGQVVTTPQLLFGSETGLIESGGELRTASVTAITMNGSGPMTNNGLIATTGDLAMGIRSNASNAVIINNGTISTAGPGRIAHAIYSTGAFAELTNNGTITTVSEDALGMYADLGTNAIVINNGTMSMSGVFASALVTNTNNGILTNNGTITIAGARGAALSANGLNGGNQQLINSGTIIVSGSQSFAIDSSGPDAIVTNSGNIQLSASSVVGISTRNRFTLAPPTSTTINNSGTIMAATPLDYAILGGNGADTVNLLTGSQINGVIDTSGGIDTININDSAANGTMIIRNAEAVNFLSTTADTNHFSGKIEGQNTLLKAGSGTLVLSGTNNYTGLTTITAGTLTLQGGSALRDSAAVDMVDGTLDVENAEAIGALSGAGTVNLHDDLTVGGAADSTYAGLIQGAGGLIKHGTGVLTLAGPTTYSGGTRISEGTLQGTVTTLHGDIVDDATLSFDQAFTGTYANAISGSGGLRKLGTGTVVLSGTNTYRGRTTITTGTLSLQGGAALFDSSAVDIAAGTLDVDTAEIIGALSGSGTVNLDADLTVGDSSNSSYVGVIQGVGHLTKQGSGTLQLLGITTYQGGTTVAEGTLLGTTTTLHDNIVVHGTVEFEQGFTGTYADIISGTGGLTKSGTGNLTLSGANTYTGTTTVREGTLSLRGGSALADNAAVEIREGTLQIDAAETFGALAGSGRVVLNADLTVGDASSTSFAGTIDGTGGVVKQGNGTLTLSGDNTYSGTTHVADGILVVNGALLHSLLVVGAGGAIGGHGALNDIQLGKGATIAPGNSIGIISFDGDVNFSAGAIYKAEVDADGHSDQIKAGGRARLTGGSVQVLPAAGQYLLRTDYTLLTAVDGLGDTRFDSVVSSLPFLSPTLRYDATHVFLRLQRNALGFNAVAETRNQAAVAKVLENLALRDPAAVESIVNPLLFGTAAGARLAFDSLSGAQYVNVQSVLNELHDPLQRVIFARLGRSNSNPGSAAHGAELAVGGHTVWINAYSRFGAIGEQKNVAGSDFDTAGLAFGAEQILPMGLRFGLAAAYGGTSVDAYAGQANIDSYQVALYGAWQHDALYIATQAGVGYHDIAGDRRVTINAVQLTPKADYGALQFHAALETGKDFALSEGSILTPYVSMQYAHLSGDDFAETGAGQADLSIDTRDRTSVRGESGLRLKHTITRHDGWTFTPRLEAGVVHEFLDNTSALRSAFVEAPGDTFVTKGPHLTDDHAHIGVGLTARLRERVSLDLSYDGNVSSSDESHALSAMVSYRW